MKRKTLLSVVAAAMAACGAGSAYAVDLYSFETGTDGFGPNGGGVTVSQDVIGATAGTSSLKVSVVDGATFVGALSGSVPAAIGDPPGLDNIYFDLTIAPGGSYAGSFASIGVTVFGASQPGPGQQFGLQAQFADFEAVEGKTPGTYLVQIDLTSATHPLTFATGQSFNQIFGTVGSGTNDLIPTGFQFFVSKSNNAPLTVYIDNVRTTIPEPATLALAGLAGLAIVAARRKLA